MKIANPTARLGEDIATNYLQKKGYRILERNFRKGYGEIDIIAVKDNTLVFVEVKTRKSNSYGTPLESITHWKIRPLVRTAEFYAQLHPKLPQLLRIDAISVILQSNDEISTIEHVENIL